MNTASHNEDGLHPKETCCHCLQKEIALYAEYTKLLGNELAELSAWAGNHGWKSSRYEEGKRLRGLLGLEKGKDAEVPDGR